MNLPQVTAAIRVVVLTDIEHSVICPYDIMVLPERNALGVADGPEFRAGSLLVFHAQTASLAIMFTRFELISANPPAMRAFLRPIPLPFPVSDSAAISINPTPSSHNIGV